MTDGNDGKLNRVLIVAGFILQLVMSIYAYGKLTQSVEDIGRRLERVERWIDGQS